MTGGKNLPVWLCRWPGEPTQYITAKTAGAAAVVCQRAGQAVPASITFAGYHAEPDPEPKQKRTTKPARPATKRAEFTLTIYGLLRMDWPIGSVLSAFDAEAKWQVSNAALRDFVANVGTAIGKVDGPLGTLHHVINATSRAWGYAAQERNAIRAGDWNRAEYLAEKKLLWRGRARRLRKRREYQVAAGELEAALEGVLPLDVIATENFRKHLITHGLAADDAESLARRYRRISTPKM